MNKSVVLAIFLWKGGCCELASTRRVTMNNDCSADLRNASLETHAVFVSVQGLLVKNLLAQEKQLRAQIAILQEQVARCVLSRKFFGF